MELNNIVVASSSSSNNMTYILYFGKEVGQPQIEIIVDQGNPISQGEEVPETTLGFHD